MPAPSRVRRWSSSCPITIEILSSLRCCEKHKRNISLRKSGDSCRTVKDCRSDTIAYSLSVIQTIILFNYWTNVMTKIYLLAETEITAPEAAPVGIENAGGTLADDRRTLLPGDQEQTASACGV